MPVIVDQYCLFLKGCRLMEEIRQYLLSIIAAAIICAVVIRIAGQKNMVCAMIKLFAGLFMSLTVISPLLKLQIGNFSDYLSTLELDADCYISEAEESAAFERSGIITNAIESYILDKATSLGVTIQVEVELSDTDKQTPNKVVLVGDISPYNKLKLQQIIKDDLGIPEENQFWT